MGKNKRINYRLFIYILLFIFVMVIDQRIFTSWNLVRSAFRQATAIPFLIILLLQMNKIELKKIRYRVYVFFAGLMTLVGWVYLFNTEEFYLQYCTFLVEVAIVGFILLYIVTNKDRISWTWYIPMLQELEK